jgi:hypothetical protein
MNDSHIKNPLFATHLLNADGLTKAMRISLAFTELYNELKLITPQDSREWSLAQTRLEEACFFAKKAMAVRDENRRT